MKLHRHDLVLGQEVLRRLVVDLSKLDQFEHFEAAFARLTFREERMRSSHPGRDLPLRQPCLVTGRNQFLQKPIVQSLMLRRSPLARDTRLRFLLFLHLSSVRNA